MINMVWNFLNKKIKMSNNIKIKKNPSQIDLYLIQKAWDIRRNGEFIDWEIAKQMIRGNIDIWGVYFMKRKRYGIEKHSGGKYDVGVITESFNNRNEAIRVAMELRRQDKRHGYRVREINY